MTDPQPLDAIGEFKEAVWRIVTYSADEGTCGYLLTGDHVDKIAGEAQEYAKGLAVGALTSGERDLVHRDLGQLLEAVGLGDFARPESPHEVFQMALAEVGRIQKKAAADERERVARRCDDWSEEHVARLIPGSGPAGTPGEAE
jgi:hypothetical protein